MQVPWWYVQGKLLHQGNVPQVVQDGHSKHNWTLASALLSSSFKKLVNCVKLYRKKC